MKVEWLNEELTRARITVGLFRRRSALVFFDSGCWCFERDKSQVVGMSIGRKLQQARVEWRVERCWERPLPRAKTIAAPYVRLLK